MASSFEPAVHVGGAADAGTAPDQAAASRASTAARRGQGSGGSSFGSLSNSRNGELGAGGNLPSLHARRLWAAMAHSLPTRLAAPKELTGRARDGFVGVGAASAGPMGSSCDCPAWQHLLPPGAPSWVAVSTAPAHTTEWPQLGQAPAAQLGPLLALPSLHASSFSQVCV